MDNGFLKFAITNMKQAVLDLDRDFLEEHKHSRGFDTNYDRTSEDERLQQYLKAINLRTIKQENK
jgi:hypothetical protein